MQDTGFTKSDGILNYRRNSTVQKGLGAFLILFSSAVLITLLQSSEGRGQLGLIAASAGFLLCGIALVSYRSEVRIELAARIFTVTTTLGSYKIMQKRIDYSGPSFLLIKQEWSHDEEHTSGVSTEIILKLVDGNGRVHELDRRLDKEGLKIWACDLARELGLEVRDEGAVTEPQHKLRAKLEKHEAYWDRFWAKVRESLGIKGW